MDQKRNKYIKFVIEELEGGSRYTDHPNDLGGKTKFGVTETLAKKHSKRVESLTLDEAIDIYDKEFYISFMEKYNNNLLLMLIFHFSVNTGKKRSIMLLQRSINELYENKVKEDGVMKENGETDLAISSLIKNKKINSLIACLLKNQFQYYLELSKKVINNKDQSVFLEGWNNRIFKVLKAYLNN